MSANRRIIEACGKLQGDYVVIEAHYGDLRGQEITPGSDVSYGFVERVPQERATHFVPNYMLGSDYSGDTVELANFELMQEEHADKVVLLHGGHWTRGVAIPLNSESDELADILEGLETYPVIDEDQMSHVEMRLQDEAWENWARSDFKRVLRKLFPESEDTIDDATDDSVWELFHAACDTSNSYWQAEGPSMWVDLDRVAAVITADQVAALPQA